jgi:hypothetical protein
LLFSQGEIFINWWIGKPKEGRKMKETSAVVCRRAYKRYTLKGSIHLLTLDGKEAFLSLKNLSGAGVCVRGNYPFRVNEFVTITIQTDSPFFTGLSNREARVAWIKQVASDLWETGLDIALLG